MTDDGKYNRLDRGMQAQEALPPAGGGQFKASNYFSCFQGGALLYPSSPGQLQ